MSNEAVDIEQAVLVYENEASIVEQYEETVEGGSVEVYEKKGKGSGVWIYFTKLENSVFSKCNLCDKMFKSSGNTTNLLCHLKCKHIESYQHVISFRKSVIKKTPTYSYNNIETYADQFADDTSSTTMVSQSMNSCFKIAAKEEFIDKKRNTSKVWNFYSKTNDFKVCECNLCGKLIKSSGNTTNLKGHLKSKHFDVYNEFGLNEGDASMNASISKQRIVIKKPTQDVEKTKKGGKKPSKVWNFFTKTEDPKQSKCNLCEQIINSCGNTTNLNKHLKSRHALEYGLNESTGDRCYLKKELFDEANQESEYINEENVEEDFDLESEVNSLYAQESEDENNAIFATKSKNRQAIKQKSIVWKYFTKTGGHKFSQCNLCDKIIKTSGNTTNLKCHLRNKHRDEISDVFEDLTRQVNLESSQVEVIILKPASSTEDENPDDGDIAANSESDIDYEPAPKKKRKSNNRLKRNKKVKTSTSKTSSIAWNYFTRTDDESICKCNECGVMIKSSGNTTNLICHLRNKHIELLTRDKSFQQKPVAKKNTSKDATEENVWEFFTKTKHGCVCSICFQVIKSFDNTTNLISHLKAKHLQQLNTENDKLIDGEMISSKIEHNDDMQRTPKRQKSIVWNFFSKVNKEITCNLCMKPIKTCGNTSNMKSHLVRCHPKEFEDNEKTTSQDILAASISGLIDNNDTEQESHTEIPPLPKRHSAKLRSKVWRFYSKVNDTNFCNLCQKEVKSDGNTTNLIKHLKSQHIQYLRDLRTEMLNQRKKMDEISKEDSQHNDVSMKIDNLSSQELEEFTEGNGTFNDDADKSEEAFHEESFENLNDSDLSDEEDIPLSCLVKIKSPASTSKETVTVQESSEKITRALADCIKYEKSFTLDLVSTKHFKNFVSMLNPRYSFPSKRVLKKLVQKA